MYYELNYKKGFSF